MKNDNNKLSTPNIYMQERLQLRSNMMSWSERAKTVLVIELTVQLEGKFDEVKQDKCVI